MPSLVALDGDTRGGGYLAAAQRLVRRVLLDTKAVMDSAASTLADRIAEGARVHVVASGAHSRSRKQESLLRAGGLRHVNAIFDEGELLLAGALHEVMKWRTAGDAGALVFDSVLAEGDVVIILDAHCLDGTLLHIAIEARRRGAFLVGVSSRRTSANTSAPNPIGLRLADVVDIAIDCGAPTDGAKAGSGQTGLAIDKLTTFVSSFALNCLAIRTVTKLVDRGTLPAAAWPLGTALSGSGARTGSCNSFKGQSRVLT